MDDLEIIPYEATWQEAVLQLTLRAWTPVFVRTKEEVPSYVYDAFYPHGWEKRQISDVSDYLTTEGGNCWLARRGKTLCGYIGLRLHPEDKMGEIYILATDPDVQRQGVARRLMDFAENIFREADMSIAMVETVGDSGHAPARQTYEARGYERWPVARYFKAL